MSKSESSVGLILALVVTFGLSAAAIWWAHQFGFGTHSSVENQLQIARNSSQSISSVEETQTPMSVLPASNLKSANNAENSKPTPTVTATPKRAKTADDLKNFPVKGQVKFIINSNQITSQGQQVLERLAQEIRNFNTEGVIIRINVGGSESSKALAQQRGEDIAGYLRDNGLGHKIFISNRGSREDAKQTRNPPIEVRLVKK